MLRKISRTDEPRTTKRKKASTMGPTVKGYFLASLLSFLLVILELYFPLFAFV